MKKYLFCIPVLLAGIAGKTQGLVPKPIPCFEPVCYMHPSSPGAYNIYRLFSNYSCVDVHLPSPDGTLITEGKTDVVAGEAIVITDAVIGPFDTSTVVAGDGGPYKQEFHAYLGHNDFEVVWFEPNSTPGYVGQYEKLELGIKLPAPLDSMVWRYIHDIEVGAKLNPFNPDSVNIEAEFLYLGEHYSLEAATSSKKAYGFYYEEHIQPSITDTYWMKDTTSYAFRIRFAPDKIGNWAVKIKIYSPAGNYEVLPINFKCVVSSNPGFVKTGTGNRAYFKLGNETFVPVGQNLFSPFAISDSPPFLEFEMYGNIDVKPRGYYDYKARMQSLASNGANFFRMIIAGPATEIEFEKLGNYTDRMDNAWEMDKILDKAKELDLYMNYNLQIHYAFENGGTYSHYYWDWKANSTDNQTNPLCSLEFNDPGHCYHHELGLTNPIDFITSPAAMKHYKNRLRYLVSRYGYSTNIAFYELFSEIDNIGQGQTFAPSYDGSHTDCNGNGPCCYSTHTIFRDYRQNNAHGIASAQAIATWQKEMARYIKEDLDHTQHLIAANYTGGPSPGERNNAYVPGTSYRAAGPDLSNDDTYNDGNIDVMTYNFYGTHIDRFKEAQEQVDYLITNSVGSDRQKPFMFSEIGGDAEDCSNDVEWLRQEWIAPFTGAAGAGNPWGGQYDDNRWHYFGIIRNFINGYNFADEEWTPVYDKRNDGKSDVYALVSENKDESIGVIINRTVNFYTAASFGSWCGSTDNANENGIGTGTGLNTAALVQYNDSWTNELKIDLEPGNYIVHYFNGLTGNWMGSDYETVFLGKINLEHPDMNPLGGTFIIPFKAWKSGSKSLMIEADSNMFSKDTEKAGFNKLTAVPNPANDKVTLSVEVIRNNQYIRVYTATGQCLVYTEMTERKIELDTRQYGNGVYTVVITNDTEVLTQKIIIQK